jgi:S-adenosylmethionine:tRNA ribosyltransferase-isomerase
MTDLDLAEHYEFALPRELIAQHPLARRTDARLLRLRRSSSAISHHHVRDLPKLFRRGDLLVLNDTKVLPARLAGFRTGTGGHWEGLFLRTLMNHSMWEVLSKTRGKLVVGESITLLDREAREGLELIVVGKGEDGQIQCRLKSPRETSAPDDGGPSLEMDAMRLLQIYGRVPLPPYIREGRMVDDDIDSYQTVYAKSAGSIAAPTAGLHFTQELLHDLTSSGIQLSYVSLHVGIGTFRPLKTARLSDHVMHSEWGQLTEKTAQQINQARKEGRRIIAVGTTAVRVLESAAAQSGTENTVTSWNGETNLFIRPGHRFLAVDGLMTNFHLPRSTLLVLVSAFASRESILRAYQEAVQERYRFFSYGDAMLID